jgi:flavin-dependent dehydrogenase
LGYYSYIEVESFGIGPALAYGKLAAEAISSAFQQLDFSFSEYKRRLLTSSLGHYLLYQWFITWLSYHLSGSSLIMYSL